MIILLRLRNLTIFALLVLSVSFIYIGYMGFGENQIAEKQELDGPQIGEVTIETIQPIQNNPDRENPLRDFNPVQNVDELKNTDNFFVEFRMKRDKGRDAQIELLREIVNNPNSSASVRDKAQNKLFDISESIALEVKAENLLKAKGYQEAVVVIESGNITVVVQNNNLKQVDMTRIGDLVKRTTGYKAEKLVIIPK